MRILSKLIAGGLIVQVLVAISVMISSRLYKPEIFGDLGWYLSFASLFSVLAALRFDYIVLSDRVKSEEKNNFFSNAVLVNLIILIVFSVVLLILNNIIYFKYNIIYLICFCFSLSFFNLMSQYLILIKDYKNYVALKTCQVIFQIFIIVAFYYILPQDGLLLASIIPQLFIPIIYFLLKRNIFKFNFLNFKAFIRKNIAEGIKNSSLAFMQYSTPVVPVLVGGYIFDKSNIGVYFLFSQAIAAPFALIRRNVLILFNGEYNDRYKIKKLFNKIISFKNIAITFFIFLCVLILLILSSKYLVLVFFGSTWVSYSWLMLVLFIYYFIDALLQPLTTLYPLWGKVNKALIFELTRFFFVALLLPTIAFFFKIPFIWFVILFLTFMTLIYLVNFLSILSYVKRLK